MTYFDAADFDPDYFDTGFDVELPPPLAIPARWVVRSIPAAWRVIAIPARMGPHQIPGRGRAAP